MYAHYQDSDNQVSTLRLREKSEELQDSLLWVVCRVGKYSRIEALFDSITTYDYNTMLIGVNEFVIK